MAPARLEVRDLEILRALVRVRYLTTRQISRAFFSCPRVGRRRLQRLSELDLIRPHVKGLPEALRYSAWRLTSRGVDEAAHALPDEPIPDGLVERVASGSLHNALHREALADLYLHLVVPDRSRLAERDLRAHRRWASEMRGRARALTWQPDGDVLLSTSYLGRRVDVVPDAVVRSAARKRRVFVELDRSTKDLGRIREGLERYALVLDGDDLGGDRATILFVVRSAVRKSNVQALGATPGLVVLREPEAVEWLREELFVVPSAKPARERDESLEAVARRAYVYMTRLHDLMRTNGMHETLGRQQPTFMNEGHDRLLALYRSLKSVDGEGARS